jgi:5-methylcytosine-specific restriction endonuclease McrA
MNCGATVQKLQNECRRDNVYSLRAMSHRVAIPAAVRRDLWITHFGTAGIAPCPVCATRNITPFEFEAGHKISVAHGGGSEIGNLVPICGLCNKSMGARDIDEYMERNKITPRSPIYVCRDVEMAPPPDEAAAPTSPARSAASPTLDATLDRELRAYHAEIAALFGDRAEWRAIRREYAE